MIDLGGVDSVKFAHWELQLCPRANVWAGSQVADREAPPPVTEISQQRRIDLHEIQIFMLHRDSGVSVRGGVSEFTPLPLLIPGAQSDPPAHVTAPLRPSRPHLHNDVTLPNPAPPAEMGAE